MKICAEILEKLILFCLKQDGLVEREEMFKYIKGFYKKGKRRINFGKEPIK